MGATDAARLNWTEGFHGCWAKLLGEGALGSFLRLESVEESGRSEAVRSNAEGGDVVHLIRSILNGCASDS